MCMVAGGTAFFAGVSNMAEPGAIHVLDRPFADEGRRQQELQVHEAPVTKMTLNYDHSLLFSGGEDGSLAVMVISDRPKAGTIPDVTLTKEVLVPGKFYH